MKINVIINSIIIILIFHFIIINYLYTTDNIINIGHYNNDKRIENFLNNKDKKSDSKDKKDNASINFLKDESANDKFKEKLMKYIEEPNVKEKTEFEKKNVMNVAPSNTYLTNTNMPNFESNVADIKKFYTVNYDNLDEKQLQATSIEDLNKIKDPGHINIDDVSKQPCNIKSYGRESTVTPDNWVYKDELPMNGGNMSGIIGFDNLESQFAIFNPNKVNLQAVKEDQFKNIPHDDLRKPIIYE